MSSSEEDSHQCGRCKLQFHSLDLFINHKKNKTCQKAKLPQNDTDVTENKAEVGAPSKGIGTLNKGQGTPTKGTGISNKGIQSYTETTPVKAPAKKRRAARELVKSNDAPSGGPIDGANDRRGRSSKRRTTAKNLKKAWAENYKDSVEEDESAISETKRELTGHRSITVPMKKRLILDGTAVSNGGLGDNILEGSAISGNSVIESDAIEELVANDTCEDSKQCGTEIVVRELNEPGDGFEMSHVVSRMETRFSGQKRAECKSTDSNDEFEQKKKKCDRRLRGTQYSCPGCNFVTYLRGEFDRHLRKNHTMSSYSCSMCTLQVKHPSRLESHVTKGPCTGATINLIPYKYSTMLWPDNPANTYQEQDIGGIMCLRVVFPYNDNDVYINYMDLTCSGQHGVIQLSVRCLQCDHLSKSYTDILQHFRDHFGFIPAICYYCAKMFPSRRALFRHINGVVHDHLSESQLTQTKKQLSQLIDDQQWKDSSIDTQCLKCDEKFDDLVELATHLVEQHKVCSIERCFHCGVCGEVHMTKSSLERHLANIHPNTVIQVKYKCPVCDKMFKLRVKAMKHRESLHTPYEQAPYDEDTAEDTDRTLLDLDELCIQKEMTCSVCFEIFPCRSDWLRHMYKHRVWVPDIIQSGPYPTNLFEEIISNDCVVLKICTQIDDKHRVNRRLTKTDPVSVLQTLHNTPDPVSVLQTLHNTPDPVSVLQNMAENIPKPGDNDSIVTNNDFMVTTSDSIVTSDYTVDNSLDCLLTTVTKVTSGTSITTGNGYKQGVGAIDPLSKEGAGDILSQEGASVELSPADTDWLDEDVTEDCCNDVCERLLCPYCLILTDSLQQMYQHKVNHHKLRLVFRCVTDGCNLMFPSLHDYIGHMSVHSQKSFVCNSCNWHVVTLTQLLAHKASSHKTIHSLDTGHCCQICHLTFGNEKALLHHIHQDQHHHQCDECQKVFKNASELEDHKMVHTDIKVLLCDKCGATFVNKLALNRHKSIHNIRKHVCQQCHKSFNKGEHLRRHMISIHSDAKPHECTHPGCDKRFKRKDKMLEHLKKHAEDKPYGCKTCGRRYRYREGLKYHEKKAHISEGTHQCPKCSVTFNRPSMLQQHLQDEHSVKKKHAYYCHICDADFSRPERLNRHLEKDHKQNINWLLKCPICQRGFPGQKSYDSHMKCRHKNKKEEFCEEDVIQQAMDQAIHSTVPTQVIHAHPLYEPLHDNKVYQMAAPTELHKTADNTDVYSEYTTNQMESYPDKPTATVEWFTQPLQQLTGPSVLHTVTGQGIPAPVLHAVNPLNISLDSKTETAMTDMNVVNIEGTLGLNDNLNQSYSQSHSQPQNQPSINQSSDISLVDTAVGTVDIGNSVINITPSTMEALSIPVVQHNTQNTPDNFQLPVKDKTRKTPRKRNPRKVSKKFDSIDGRFKSLPVEMTHSKRLMQLAKLEERNKLHSKSRYDGVYKQNTSSNNVKARPLNKTSHKTELTTLPQHLTEQHLTEQLLKQLTQIPKNTKQLAESLNVQNSRQPAESLSVQNTKQPAESLSIQNTRQPTESLNIQHTGAINDSYNCGESTTLLQAALTGQCHTITGHTLQGQILTGQQGQPITGQGHILINQDQSRKPMTGLSEQVYPTLSGQIISGGKLMGDLYSNQSQIVHWQSDGTIASNGEGNKNKDNMLEQTKENNMLTTNLTEQAKANIVLHTGLLGQSKDGIVLAGLTGQSKDGMFLTSGPSEANKEGVLFSPDISKNEGMIVTTPGYFHGKLISPYIASTANLGDNNMLLTTANNKGGFYLATKDGLLLPTDSLNTWLNLGKQTNEIPLVLHQPSLQMTPSLPHAAFVLTSQPSHTASVNAQQSNLTAAVTNPETTTLHAGNIIPQASNLPAGLGSTLHAGPSNQQAPTLQAGTTNLIDVSSQPAYLLSGGTMSIPPSTTQTYM